jgi:hypothetical protein
MFKKIFFAGITASVFSTIISVAYIFVFKYSPLEVDFTEKASIGYFLSLNMTIGMITCFVYYALMKLLKKEHITSFIVGFLLGGTSIIMALMFMSTHS